MSTDSARPIVLFQPFGRRVDASRGHSLLEAAHDAGIRVLSVCGGAGVCDSCRVRVVRGEVSSLSAHERDQLHPDDVRRGYRLACQARVLGDVVVDVPPESIGAAQRLQLEWDPGIAGGMSSQNPADTNPQTTRIGTEKNGGDGRATRNQGSGIRNQEAGPGARNQESTERTGTLTSCAGLAVDIGTTKIAAYLVDLDTGRTLAARAAVNPQVAHGEDVISRIGYAGRTPDGARELSRLVVTCINELLRETCEAASIGRDRVIEAVLVGNTVMHHLVTGLPVCQLGRAPYAPAQVEAMRVPADVLGLELAPAGQVYLPPNVAGYIGGDHVAVLTAVLGTTGSSPSVRSEHGRQAGAALPPFASVKEQQPGTAQHPPVRLIIDIGTNTEVSLVTDTRILSCSCASGPAFEGGHISCGMRAVTGAIERVRVIADEVRYETIDGGPPIGICGSGVLDAVAELVANGALDRHGGFRRGHRLVSERGGQALFVLAAGEATGHNRELVLTRHDISEIQLAKAAIRTGIDVLLRTAGIEDGEIDEVIIAGAFGSYIDLASARRTKMLPNLPAGRFHQVGNAAGAGARQMLVAPGCRRGAEQLAARIEHVDLTKHARFADAFASALGF